MSQLDNYNLCKYCFGCNRLENENFFGIKKCDDFIGAEKWQKNLKNKFSKTNTNISERRNQKMNEIDNFTGIERIKILASKATVPGIKKVAEYLINREDMNEKYQNQEKDLEDMWDYITDRAKEKAVFGTACIEDTEVYNWAIHYWDETEENLSKENEKNNNLPKKENKKAQKASSEETDISKDNKTITLEADENHELTKESYEQLEKVFNDNDIVFKWKGKDVTRAQFNSKEYLSW